MKIIDAIARWMTNIAEWLLLILCLIIVYEVAMRYAFVRPTTWVGDFSEYILLYSTFLAAGQLSKEGRHVRITLLVEHLGAKSRSVIDFIASLVAAVICAILLWRSSMVTWAKFLSGTVVPRPIEVPEWILVISFVIGNVFLCIYFLKSAISIARGCKSEEPASES